MILYDLRTDDDQSGYIAAVNAGMKAETDKIYLTAHGDVGSERWWQDFDAGRIPYKVRTGTITHVGLTEDPVSGGDCDIVRFHASDRDHEYDRDGFWINPSIQVGNTIKITTTKVEIATIGGPVTYLIDVKVELQECQQDAASNGW